MTLYDPPSDPFGNDKQCPFCDAVLVYDPYTKEWYCPKDHEEDEETEEQS